MRLSSRARATLWLYAFLTPWLLGLLLFQAGPLLATLALSLSDWRAAELPRWAGLQHYRSLADDPLFARTVLNTAAYTFGSVVPGMALALALACLLNSVGRARSLFATIFFLPAIIPGAALALAWGWVFNPRYGLANRLLSIVGLPALPWLADERSALPTLILMSCWGIGASALVYLAALRRLPRELLDAATLDGANGLARFRHVTFPLLAPATIFLLIANTAAAWQVFTPTYMLTGGGPNHATLTAALYVYLNAFSWGRPGYAAALSWLLFLVVLLLTLAQLRLVEARTYYASD
jgi:multiple sugar transport system permease protein